jgi:TolB protein
MRALRPSLIVILALGFGHAVVGQSEDPLDPIGSPPVATSSAGHASGRLMFSRFDEATHTFLTTHTALPDGSDETVIPLPGPEGGGRWSRSGEEIAVMTILADGRVGTAIITADGTPERVLDIPDESLNAVCVVWSPDDGRLACEAWDDGDPSRGGIYSVRSSDGGDLQRLTTTPDGMADHPGDYSPDGTQLIFLRAIEEADGDLMLVDVAGGEQRSLSPSLFGDAGRFSPDGEAVLTSASGRIVTLDDSGAVLHEFGDPDLFLFGPVWSPDGAWIAFSGTTGGFIADIYISRPDGTDRRQVTSTPANEIAVDWGASAGA